MELFLDGKGYKNHVLELNQERFKHVFVPSRRKSNIVHLRSISAFMIAMSYTTYTYVLQDSKIIILKTLSSSGTYAKVKLEYNGKPVQIDISEHKLPTIEFIKLFGFFGLVFMINYSKTNKYVSYTLRHNKIKDHKNFYTILLKYFELDYLIKRFEHEDDIISDLLKYELTRGGV